MIEALVARVFATRNVAHILHWRTQSYAEHKALGKFYSDLPDMIDAIVEAYQGRFALIGPVPVISPPPAGFSILQHLTDECGWIELNCDAITQENEAIENLVYNLLEAYYTTIYKLRNLH